MKTVRAPGSNPAHVQDIATADPRFDFDFDDPQAPDRTDYSLVNERFEGTITREQYWRQRCAAAPAPPVAPFDQFVDDWQPAAFDSFTIDAEILVERLGQGVFTTDELAALLGIPPKILQKRLDRGRLPKPRHPAEHGRGASGTTPNRWTAPQVVEILAVELRKAAK